MQSHDLFVKFNRTLCALKTSIHSIAAMTWVWFMGPSFTIRTYQGMYQWLDFASAKPDLNELGSTEQGMGASCTHAESPCLNDRPEKMRSHFGGLDSKQHNQ